MTTNTVNFNAVVKPEFDHCEHLSVGQTAYAVHYESDCCGPVAAYAACKDCHEKIEVAAENEEYECDDCGAVHPLKEMKVWKEWDFSYSAGDEPMHICPNCVSAPKHVERVRKDKASYERECDYLDSDE